MRISLHLSENQNEVQKQIENCADILFRPLMIGEKEKTEAFLIYIEVAVSNLMLEDSVIGKLFGGSDSTWLLFHTKRRTLRSIPALEIWNPAFGQLLWDSGRDAWLFSSADADGRAGKLRDSLALSLCGRQSQ